MGKNKSLILILLLGFLLRLININQSLWLDEASQAQLSSMSIEQIWFNRGADFHPPLFYFISHFWLEFGRSEVWIRLLPISFGVSNIFLIYLVAKHLKLNSSLAALLLAVAPFHIYYSQEFRSYSLLSALGTLSMLLLLKKKFLLLSVVNALLLYTHYSSIFLIIAQLIIQPRSFIYLVVTALLYAPWLPQFINQLNSGTNIDQYLPGWRNVLSIAPIKTLPVTLFKLIAGRINFLNRYLYGLYIIFVFSVTFATILFSKNHKKLLLAWAFIPIFVMMLVSSLFPQNQPFRVIFVLPAFILFFVQAIARFPKTFITLLIYISIVGNLAYFTRPRLQREQWKQAALFLQNQASTVLVKFPGAFSPLVWYAPNLPVLPVVSKMPASYEQVSNTLGLLGSHINRIFLLQYLTDLSDPTRVVDKVLIELGFSQTYTHNFEGVGFIYEFSKE